MPCKERRRRRIETFPPSSCFALEEKEEGEEERTLVIFNAHLAKPRPQCPPSSFFCPLLLRTARPRNAVKKGYYFLLQKMLRAVLPKTILFSLPIAYHHETLAKTKETFLQSY